MKSTSARRRVTLDLDEGFRRRAEAAAARRGETVAVYIRRVLQEALESDESSALYAHDDPVLAEVWGSEAERVWDEV